jgi:hypothetical protein
MVERNISFAVMNAKLVIKQHTQRITGKTIIKITESRSKEKSKLSSVSITTSSPGIKAHNPAINPFLRP